MAEIRIEDMFSSRNLMCNPLAHTIIPDEISPKTYAWGAFGGLA
jgi:hypothetical protein